MTGLVAVAARVEHQLTYVADLIAVVAGLGGIEGGLSLHGDGC